MFLSLPPRPIHAGSKFTGYIFHRLTHLTTPFPLPVNTGKQCKAAVCRARRSRARPARHIPLQAEWFGTVVGFPTEATSYSLCSMMNVYVSCLDSIAKKTQTKSKHRLNSKAPFTKRGALWETKNSFEVVKLSPLMGVLSMYRAFSTKYLITWYTTRKLDKLLSKYYRQYFHFELDMQ